MDYSNIPELKNSIESATPAMVQSTLDASNGKPTKDKPIYSTVTMSGNRVVSVKTYKSKEEQEKAILKERKRLDKVTAERQAKRKDETRTDMLKGLTPIPILSTCKRNTRITKARCSLDHLVDNSICV